MSIGKKSRSQVSKLRPLIYERDEHTCVAAGSLWSMLFPCAGQLEIQHRVKKGSGGSALYDGPEYLVTMCHLHNSMDGGGSAEFRQACLRNGWSVLRWLADSTPMSRIPIRYKDRWYLLSGLRRHAISEATAIDMMTELYGEDY